MPRRKLLRTIIISLLALPFVLFGALCLLLYFNRHRIAEYVKQDINRSLYAEFDFGKAGLSLRHFPYLGICLESFSLTGIEEFAGDTLIAGDAMILSLNLRSVLRSTGATEVRNLHFEKPVIRILITEAGTANFDIFIEEPEDYAADTAYAMHLILRDYSFRNATLHYDDRESEMSFSLEGLDHRGSGDFTEEVFDLAMRTRAKSFSFDYGGIRYLKDVALDLTNTLHIDLIEDSYRFDDAVLKLNDLRVNLNGFVQYLDDEMRYALEFSSPQNDFKSLFSILPYAYTRDFAKLQAAGTFLLSGSLASGTNDFPKLAVDLNVAGGSFRYPDLPFGFQDIRLEARFENPGTIADATVIDVPALRWTLDGKPFDARVVLRNPVSDPAFDGHVRGSLDLAALQLAFPIVGIEMLSGLAVFDIEGRGRLSALEAGRYDEVQFAGDISAQNIVYFATDRPVITVSNAQARFSPATAEISTLQGTYGRSDFALNGSVEHPLLILSGRGGLAGNLDLNARRIDFNEFLSEGSEATASVATVPVIYETMQLHCTASVDTLYYNDYILYESHAQGKISGQRADVEAFRSIINGQALQGHGIFDNLWNYNFLDEILTGNLSLESRDFNLNPFIGTDESASLTTSAQAYQVPANFNLDIRFTSGKVVLHDFDLTDFHGRIHLHDGVVEMHDIRSGFLGGDLRFSGVYDSRDPARPLFSFQYQLDQLDFRKTFDAVNIFAVLAPLAKFIEGRFNSTLSFSSELTPGYAPVLRSINAEGLLHTLRGEVRLFPPLEKAADLLQLDFLRRIPIDGSKNWFSVNDGTVIVEPFSLNYQDVTMHISGRHTLEHDMHYILQMELPFARIRDKLGVGQPLAVIRDQAQNLGIQLREGIRINLLVDLRGTISSPEVSFRLLSNIREDLFESVKEQLEAKIDSVKEEVVQKVEEVVAEVKEDLEARRKALEAEVNARITILHEQATDHANRIRAEAHTLADRVRTEGYAQADNLVAAAGNDPLRRAAATRAADKLRQETDKRVDQILQKAEAEAQAVLQRAETEADSLRRNVQ